MLCDDFDVFLVFFLLLCWTVARAGRVGGGGRVQGANLESRLLRAEICVASEAIVLDYLAPLGLL